MVAIESAKYVVVSATSGSLAGRECAACGRSSEQHLMAACDTCHHHYHLHCLKPPLQRPPKKSKLYGWQCSECDKTSDSEPELLEKKVPRRSRIRYSKDGAIITEPHSPSSPPKPGSEKYHKVEKSSKLTTPESISPIKVTIKPFEFSSDGNESSEVKLKKEKKIKKSKQRDHASASAGEGDSPSKERDSKAIESSIESTLANLSSDIATYKANRKRRKEKHRSRYSPDLLRSPSKSHKHKRKKKTQDMENPDPPHPRITIKIKPIPKPDGSLDTQMFYVPTDSNDGPPPAVMKKLSKHVDHEAAKQPPPPVEEVPPAIETPDASMRNRGERSRRGGSGANTSGAAAAATPLTHCDVCLQQGDYTNLVRCDECSKRYHFTCLEPPLNKNPKKRGYSWHCADCDPTDIEENN